MTQNELVLDYLRNHGSIDAWRAATELGILRLSARIYELIELGFNIVGEMKSKKLPDGTIKRWKEYRLGTDS